MSSRTEPSNRIESCGTTETNRRTAQVQRLHVDAVEQERPPVGRINPITGFISVDLPEPEARQRNVSPRPHVEVEPVHRGPPTPGSEPDPLELEPPRTAPPAACPRSAPGPAPAAPRRDRTDSSPLLITGARLSSVVTAPVSEEK